MAFDPATTERQLSLGAVDAAIAVLVPRIAGQLVQPAPRAQSVTAAQRKPRK